MTLLLLSLLLAADQAPAAPTTTPATPPAKEKTVCRRQVETGSLVRGRKVCLTESERRRQIEDAQRDTATMQVMNGNPGPQ